MKLLGPVCLLALVTVAGGLPLDATAQSPIITENAEIERLGTFERKDVVQTIEMKSTCVLHFRSLTFDESGVIKEARSASLELSGYRAYVRDVPNSGYLSIEKDRDTDLGEELVQHFFAYDGQADRHGVTLAEARASGRYDGCNTEHNFCYYRKNIDHDVLVAPPDDGNDSAKLSVMIGLRAAYCAVAS